MFITIAASVVCHDTGKCSRLLLFNGQKLSTFQGTATRFENGSWKMITESAIRTTFEDGPAKGLSVIKSEILSPDLKAGQEFDQLVVSWNAHCPQGSFVTIEARAKEGEEWTKWYSLGYWAEDDSVIRKTSIKGQKDTDGDVDTDTLVLAKPSRVAQVRVGLFAMQSESPTISLVSCDFSLSGTKPVEGRAVRRAKPIALPVPEISQRSYPPNGDVWCSPTSVAMVLNYWAEKMKNPLWKKDVTETAPAIHDEAWGGTGNWTFNTAYAGSLPGLTAYCCRFNSLSQLDGWITKGIPVILSVSANTLHGNGSPGGGGHLIVCVGFDEHGDVVVNDPYAALDKGEKIRCTYKRDKLFQAWRSSLGMTYLIYPSDLVPKP